MMPNPWQGNPKARKWTKRYPLERALRYRNPEIIHRFMSDYGASTNEAREIFQETKRWLWFCAYYREYFSGRPKPYESFPLLDEMYAVDEMWHTFVLFTMDYERFCTRHLGGFVHHIPTSRADTLARQRMRKRSPDRAEILRLAHLAKACFCVGQLMGNSAVRKWYSSFPKKYPKERFRRTD